MRRSAGKSAVGSIELTGLLPDSISDDQLLDVVGSDEPVLYFAEEDLLP